MNINDKRLKKQVKIMNHYGVDRQLEQFVEECSEAITAVQKIKRSHHSPESIKELKGEIADVMVTVEQMYNFFNEDGDIDRIIDIKLNRQIKRMKRGED